MNKKKVLINAQKTGSIVEVVYKTGSQPNHVRKIIPIRVKHNQVVAKCLNSHTEKSFFIGKLELLTNQQYDSFAKWDPDFIPVTDYELYETQKEHRKKMEIIFFSILGVLALLAVYITFRSRMY